MEKLTPVSDKAFVFRFFGIFGGIGGLLVAATWLRAAWTGDRREWDRLMELIGPIVGVVFFVLSLIPPSVWWGVLAAFAVWVFFSILQQVVRAAVHEPLQERERR